MSDGTKNGLKIVSGIAIGAGAAGFVLLGGSEAGAIGIVTAGIAVVGAVGAVVALIKG